MKIKIHQFLFFVILLVVCNACTNKIKNEAVLTSWNNSSSKTAIVKFVNNNTDDTNPPSFIPIKDRIVVFDNDGKEEGWQFVDMKKDWNTIFFL